MGVGAILGSSPKDAIVRVGDGTTEREQFRGSIRRLRLDLWAVESQLKTMETRTVTELDSKKLKPEFLKMFDSMVNLVGNFYGLTLAAFGDDKTIEVAKNFQSRFD